MSFQIGNIKNPQDAKRAAIEAARLASKGSKPPEAAAALVRYIPAAECPDRNRIIFDDSASMDYQTENAKKGVVEFLRNCIPNQTAVAVHFMNTAAWSTDLRSDLPQLGADILEAHLSSGDTPFFNTLKRALEAKPVLTRLIAFTDGAPTDKLQAEEETEIQQAYSFDSYSSWITNAKIIITLAHAIGGDKPIPIDTVYFGSGNERNMNLLRYLSENTGGFFLHFDSSKMNFAKAFKYLAPVHRLMLASESFRKEIEDGKRT